MKLISLREYVLRFDKPIGFYADQLDYYEGESNAMSCVISYANFLSQKLELWMFVPCKLVECVWVVLEEPKEEIEKIQNNFCRRKKEDILDLYSFDLDVKEYQEAKKSVLFEGFNLEIIPETEFTPGYKFIVGKNIRIHVYNLDKCNVEYLLLLSNEIILTPTAQKLIGL